MEGECGTDFFNGSEVVECFPCDYMSIHNTPPIFSALPSLNQCSLTVGLLPNGPFYFRYFYLFWKIFEQLSGCVEFTQLYLTSLGISTLISSACGKKMQ